MPRPPAEPACLSRDGRRHAACRRSTSTACTSRQAACRVRPLARECVLRVNGLTVRRTHRRRPHSRRRQMAQASSPPVRCLHPRANVRIGAVYDQASPPRRPDRPSIRVVALILPSAMPVSLLKPDYWNALTGTTTMNATWTLGQNSRNSTSPASRPEE